MGLSFTKELSVGNRVVDDAHKEVLGMIDEIARSIVARDVSVLLEAFELLENSLCAYFVVEENIAQALNFDFSQHTLAHQRLLHKFKRTKDVLVAKNGMWTNSDEKDYIDSLSDYLIQHIKEDCKPFKVLLNTHFYDFNPDGVTSRRITNQA